MIAVSMAGLPGGNACVRVGPPHRASGFNSGSWFVTSPVDANPHDVALSRLKPSEVT